MIEKILKFSHCGIVLQKTCNQIEKKNGQRLTQCGNFMIFVVCIIQILCEINFGDSRSTKTAVLQHVEALNSDF